MQLAKALVIKCESERQEENQCNTDMDKRVLTREQCETWWCINSMHSRRLVHTTTITWLQWVLVTPTCLLLDSGSGSSLLRQLVVGGGGLPNSSEDNLTALGPFTVTVKRSHIYIICFMRGFTRPVFLKEVEIKHSVDRTEKVGGRQWGMHQYHNSDRYCGQVKFKCEENNFNLPFFFFFFLHISPKKKTDYVSIIVVTWHKTKQWAGGK